MNSNTKNDPDNTARTHPAASKAVAPMTRYKPGGQSQSPDGIQATWTELEIHGKILFIHNVHLYCSCEIHMFINQSIEKHFAAILHTSVKH